jgi:hypothetical protein
MDSRDALALAAELIAQYGRHAARVASGRLDEHRANRDAEGAAFWARIAILVRALELQGTRRGRPN